MPGGKVKSGFSSVFGKELGLETKGLMMSSQALQKRSLKKGSLLLQWGQRKRPRVTKGITEKHINSHTPATIEVGCMQRADFQCMRWLPAVQPTGSATPSSTYCPIETAPELANRTTEDPTTSVNLPQGRNGCAEASVPVDDSGKQFPLHKKNENVSGCFTEGRVGKNHRRKELDSLHDTPPMNENGTFEPFRWPKFLVSLSWKEKEDDFMAIKGAKLPQRPKRHSKKVEKTIQYICPGTFLCEVNQDRYEVREKKMLKKKQRGLKAMDNVGSDSD